MKNEVKNIKDICEFTSAFEQKISRLTDYSKFKSRMQHVFIDQELMNICRMKNIDKKQEKFNESSNQRTKNFEKCLENSPYCHWERTAKFKEYIDHKLRVSNVSDKIKFNYFDPFKNAKDHTSYDYLKKTHDQNFMTEERFSTYSSKNNTNDFQTPLGQANFMPRDLDIDMEKEVHSEYMDNMMHENKTGKKQKMESFNSQSGKNTSNLPIDLSDLHIPEIVKTPSRRGDNETCFPNSCTVFGQQPKLNFENQTPFQKDVFIIRKVDRKTIENCLTIARCSHICYLEKHEFFNREINIRNKEKYFLIVNSILYNYLGEEIKKLHEQTLKVISDKPNSGFDNIKNCKKKRLERQRFPRPSLDRFPKNYQRFSSVDVKKRFSRFDKRILEEESMKDLKNYANETIEREKRNSQQKMVFNNGQEEDEINIKTHKERYKNAYILNEEGLKQDILNSSSRKSGMLSFSPDSKPSPF